MVKAISFVTALATSFILAGQHVEAIMSQENILPDTSPVELSNKPVVR